VSIHEEISSRDPQKSLKISKGRGSWVKEKLAFLMESPQWCIREAEKVGLSCREFIIALLNKGPVEHLRAAQGVMRCRKKYGSPRLEAACRRALYYDNITDGAVNRILKQGLDLESYDEKEALIEPIINNCRFARDIGELLYPEKRTERNSEQPCWKNVISIESSQNVWPPWHSKYT